MQNLKNIDLSKIAGGTGCSCIYIYDLTLIPVPLKTITTQEACKKSCCVNEDSRFNFNNTLFNCYEYQLIVHFTDFHPPQNKLAKLLIEEAEREGRVTDNLNQLASLIFD